MLLAGNATQMAFTITDAFPLSVVFCLVQDGDMIVVDAETKVMDVVGLSEEEWAARRAAWQAPPLKATSGTLYKFIKNVLSASEGCVTDA